MYCTKSEVKDTTLSTKWSAIFSIYWLICDVKLTIKTIHCWKTAEKLSSPVTLVSRVWLAVKSWESEKNEHGRERTQILVITKEDKIVIQNDFEEKGWNAYAIWNEHPTKKWDRVSVWRVVKNIKENGTAKRKDTEEIRRAIRQFLPPLEAVVEADGGSIKKNLTWLLSVYGIC